MQILEALEIFDIKNIENLDEAIIKKRFRELMRKNHPDVGGSEEVAKNINCAYSVLLESWKSLKALSSIPRKVEEMICLMPFNKLVEIYNGHGVKVRGENKEFELTKKNIRSNKVILAIETQIVYKGEIYSFNTLQLANMKDNYDIYCTIYDEDAYTVENIIIRAYGKEVRTNITGRTLNIMLNFEGLVRLIVHIDRIEKVS